jgi:hypothetical protein
MVEFIAETGECLPLLKGSHVCALCLALPDDFEQRFQNW